ncbi:GMC family oxidoreductase [Verrucomicrobia bacterium LW23]|nr:GMC family oxidoreductase [Verrucomicrobia bacterium LW23]
MRDLVRFYDSLFTVGWCDSYLPDLVRSTPLEEFPPALSTRRAVHAEAPSPSGTAAAPDAIVIGSGPGGAITGALLAEAGLRVLMLEEGPSPQEEAFAPQAFTVQEMLTRYRNGGLTPAMGSPKIAYVEGRCRGGGSEINSGLYHRTPQDLLAQWQRTHRLAITAADLEPHYEACEAAVSVSKLPGPAPAASTMLQRGADVLGWQCMEVPRWFRYAAADASGTTGLLDGERQSMSPTFLQRFANAGGLMRSSTRAVGIEYTAGKWRVETAATGSGTGSPAVAAPHLFLAGGAISTPSLLQRSEIRTAGGPGSRIGGNLHMHPTIKVVAEFEEEVNSEAMGVPVHQVKEFAHQGISMGCAISSPPFLALSMLDHPRDLHRVRERWRHMAIYYAMIVPAGRGRVRQLPGGLFRDPLVTFTCTADDMYLLGTGLRRLCQVLLAAGATRLYPTIAGCPAINAADGPDALRHLPASLPRDRTNLMTIHLFSSCASGENRDLCPVDSLGRVAGQKGLYVADASLLPSAPGVNPQGSIMALCHRNASAFLASRGSRGALPLPSHPL